MEKPFAITLDPGSSLANHTGSLIKTNGLHAQRGGRIRLWLNVATAMYYFPPATCIFLFSILSTANPSACG